MAPFPTDPFPLTINSAATGVMANLTGPQAGPMSMLSPTSSGTPPATGTASSAPSWVGMRTKAGRERRRLPLACMACRRKKVRCSGEKPECRQCERSRIECVYSAAVRRTDYIGMLERRLNGMEGRVMRVVVGSSPSPGPGPARTAKDSSRAGSFHRSNLRPQMSRKRGADAAFGPTGTDETGRQRPAVIVGSSLFMPNPAEEGWLMTEGAAELPPLELRKHLTHVYFEYVYGQIYPLLHRPSFVWQVGQEQVPPMLMLAICALGARFSSHPTVQTDPPFLRGEQWASHARRIALDHFDQPNITTVIVCLLMSFHEFGTCQAGRSWMFGGMAQRMAYALQLHREFDDEPGRELSGSTVGLDGVLMPFPVEIVQREMRRRVMWACFMLDRLTCSGAERPLFVKAEYMRIRLPTLERFHQLGIAGRPFYLSDRFTDADEDGDFEASQGLTAYMIRLLALWGDMVETLAVRTDKDGPDARQAVLADFQARLDGFAASLPSRYAFSSTNLRRLAGLRLGSQFVQLHMVFQQAVLFMNQSALPAIEIPADCPDDAGLDSNREVWRPTARAPTEMEAMLLAPVPVGSTSNPNLSITPSGSAIPSVSGSGPGSSPPPSPDTMATYSRNAVAAANAISALIPAARAHQLVAPFSGYAVFLATTVQIQGVFSRDPTASAVSRRNMAVNVRYLTYLKRFWGMFIVLIDNLRRLYRQTARQHGVSPGSDIWDGRLSGSTASGVATAASASASATAASTTSLTTAPSSTTTTTPAPTDDDIIACPVFERNDWYEKPRHGVHPVPGSNGSVACLGEPVRGGMSSDSFSDSDIENALDEIGDSEPASGNPMLNGMVSSPPEIDTGQPTPGPLLCPLPISTVIGDGQVGATSPARPSTAATVRVSAPVPGPAGYGDFTHFHPFAPPLTALPSVQSASSGLSLQTGPSQGDQVGGWSPVSSGLSAQVGPSVPIGGVSGPVGMDMSVPVSVGWGVYSNGFGPSEPGFDLVTGLELGPNEADQSQQSGQQQPSGDDGGRGEAMFPSALGFGPAPEMDGDMDQEPVGQVVGDEMEWAYSGPGVSGSVEQVSEIQPVEGWIIGTWMA